MKTIKNTLRPLYHSLRTFRLGFLTPIKLFFAFYQEGIFHIKTPFTKTPLNVRGKTSDVNAFYEIFALQAYEIPQGEINLILDLGANVGFASNYYAHFYPNAKIFAVEPEISNYGMLLENTKTLQNISCQRAAVWHQETTIFLQNPQSDNWGFKFDEAQPEDSNHAVPAKTVAGLITELNIGKIDILKIDVEGAEKDIFTGNTDWLANVRYMQIEIHSKAAYKAVFDALAKYPRHKSTRRYFADYFIEINPED